MIAADSAIKTDLPTKVPTRGNKNDSYSPTIPLLCPLRNLNLPSADEIAGRNSCKWHNTMQVHLSSLPKKFFPFSVPNQSQQEWLSLSPETFSDAQSEVSHDQLALEIPLNSWVHSRSHKFVPTVSGIRLTTSSTRLSLSVAADDN